jgi:predicted aspartyl protease
VKRQLGIFINAEVNGLHAKFVNDTGASLTLLSKKVYDKSPDKPRLEENKQIM